MIVEIHGPRVDLSAVDISEQRREDDVDKENLHDGLFEVEPDGLDDILESVLLINLEEEQEQAEQLDDGTQPPDLEQIGLEHRAVFLQQEIGVVFHENDELREEDDGQRQAEVHHGLQVTLVLLESPEHHVVDEVGCRETV